MIKNIMETIVKNKLDELAGKMSICSCDRCKDDIMASALNHLKPKYAVTNSGELYSKLDSLSNDETNEIMIALIKAIKIVSENPKH